MAMSVYYSNNFKLLRFNCNNIYLALGNPRIYRTEPLKRIKEFRRSIVAAKKIIKGEVFTSDMLDFKRPGKGLSPEMVSLILGVPMRAHVGAVLRPVTGLTTRLKFN